MQALYDPLTSTNPFAFTVVIAVTVFNITCWEITNDAHFSFCFIHRKIFAGLCFVCFLCLRRNKTNKSKQQHMFIYCNSACVQARLFFSYQKKQFI